MKKNINIAIIYSILAMIGGVFFREFTKFNNFTDSTALGKIHVHLFVLGTLTFLLLALFEDRLSISKQKTHKWFMILYNTGLMTMIIMLFVRGITQVLNTNLTTQHSAMISGIAGLGHISLGIGIILMLISVKKSIKETN